VHGRQLVPLARPTAYPVTGQVGLVGDRPVGIPQRIRGLTAAVELDAVADLARRVSRAAGLEAVLGGEASVRHDAAGDALRTDDARVTDVDDVRVLQVQADAKADEEDRGSE